MIDSDSLARGRCAYPKCAFPKLPLVRLCNLCTKPAHHLCHIAFEDEHAIDYTLQKLCHDCYCDKAGIYRQDPCDSRFVLAVKRTQDTSRPARFAKQSSASSSSDAPESDSDFRREDMDTDSPESEIGSDDEEGSQDHPSGESNKSNEANGDDNA